jgi:hypothetical protein
VNYLLPYFLSALPGIFHFTRQHWRWTACWISYER